VVRKQQKEQEEKEQENSEEQGEEEEIRNEQRIGELLLPFYGFRAGVHLCA
jgi:hypothetical protein